jgi:hypothetical protein
MSDQEKAQDLLIKRELIDEVLHHEDGVVKRASAATSKVTRTQIREESFSRAVLPYDPITNADLDYFGDSELPGVWFELEPDSPPARVLPYNSTPITFNYRAEKYIVLLSIVSTEEATKNVNELRTYKTDLRQMVTDNLLRDIHTQEDHVFTAEVDRTIGSSVAYASATSIENQHVVMTDATLTRTNLKRAVSYLTDRQLPVGVFLVNQRTWNEFLGWKRNEAGGDVSQDMVLKGMKALERSSLFGIPFIITIKNDLILNGAMYQFTTQEFLGNALMLEDIQVTIKKEYDIIRLRAQEQVGRTFGNTRGLQKLVYTMEGLEVPE